MPIWVVDGEGTYPLSGNSWMWLLYQVVPLAMGEFSGEAGSVGYPSFFVRRPNGIKVYGAGHKDDED